ncbi:Chromosome-associated kinesin KIF4, partial [Cyphomyrmex costatus]
SNSKNIGIQTENIDSLIEIARLEEQVKIMQLEISVLRKHMEISKKSDDIAHHRAVPLTPTATAKVNVEKLGCGCKGNCSSRICGCVKKNNKCNLSCKCDDKVCHNQKSNQSHEDKENINTIDMTSKNKNRKENETTERNQRGLFSPNVKELSKVFEDIQFNDIEFSSNEKNMVIKNLQTDLHGINNVQLRRNLKKKGENNKKQQEFMKEQVLFDPMKPRHQLSRTPPKQFEKSPEVEITIQSQLQSKPTREVISSHTCQDMKEEKINWEEHSAQLIPCKKCKRTFMPSRIQKHEACCLGSKY